jgi:hypothetical protein
MDGTEGARRGAGSGGGGQIVAWGLVALAAGLAAVGLAGPFVTGIVRYRVTETMKNQTIGLDAVLLVLVAPLCLVAAHLVRRRRPAGAAMTLGIGAFTSYMFVQYVVGPTDVGIPGNNEKLFPLYVALFAGGWMLALAAWRLMGAAPYPPPPETPRRVTTLFLVLAAVAFARYVPALADWMRSSPADRAYLAGPTFSWTVALLDLGVFLPATVATAVGLARHAPWAQRSLLLVAGWFGLVGPAVAAMAVAMYVNHDPLSSAAAAVSMCVLGAALAGVAIGVHRPLLSAPARRPRRTPRGDVSIGRLLRVVTGVTTGCVGVGAVFGGYGLLSDADGLGARREWLAGSPFHDYTVPGTVLLGVIGGGMLLTAALILARRRVAVHAAVVMAGVLTGWGTVETAVIGYRGWPQLLLLGLFVVAPAALLILFGFSVARRLPPQPQRASVSITPTAAQDSTTGMTPTR